MEFYKKMYISPKIRDPRRIRQDLQRGKGHLTVYLLVLTEGPEGRPQLEIMHCANFLQPYYKDHSVYVVGTGQGNGKQPCIWLKGQGGHLCLRNCPCIDLGGIKWLVPYFSY